MVGFSHGFTCIQSDFIRLFLMKLRNIDVLIEFTLLTIITVIIFNYNIYALPLSK